MKRIEYDYLFNYFGGDTHDGKPVMDACLSLVIKLYKDGKEIPFEDEKEPCAHGRYLFEIFDVGFDRESLFKVSRNLRVDNLFRLIYGCDRIDYKITEYSLGLFSGYVGDMEKFKEMPNIKDIPVSEPVTVTEEVFREFLFNHKDDFDITDNIRAQVPSMTWIDTTEGSGI